MNCEAKKRDGGNCKNNAMKGAKYCYVHSFGKFHGVPLHKNLTMQTIGIGIICIAATLYFGFPAATKVKQNEIKEAVDRVPQKTAELLDESKLDPNKISLGLRYAYEFDNYLGATNAFGNEDRKIDPKIPLRKKYDPNRNIDFVFIVFNENEGLPFENVYLEVVFPDDVLDVICGEGWQTQRVNKRYTYYFPQINDRPLNTYSPIGAKFPGPGEYEIFCSIDGRGIQKPPAPVKISLY